MDDSYVLDETMCDLVELIDSNSKACVVQQEEEKTVPDVMSKLMKMKGSSVLKRKLSANIRLVEKLTEGGIEAIRKQWREMDTVSGGHDYETAQSYIRSFIDRKFSDIEIRQLLHIGSSRIQRLRHYEADSMRMLPRVAVVRAAPAPAYSADTVIEAAEVVATVNNANVTSSSTTSSSSSTTSSSSAAAGKQKEGATKKRKLNAVGRLVEKLSEDGIETIRKQWREMDTGSGGKDYETAQSYIRSFIDQKFSDIEIRQLLHIGSSRIQRLRKYHHPVVDSTEVMQQESRQQLASATVPPPAVSDGDDNDNGGDSDSPSHLLLDIDNVQEDLDQQNSCVLSMS
jgi:hypothetical protein